MQDLNRYIDHTLLKADATPEDISRLCAEAIEYNFYSVCVNSCWIKVAKNELTQSDLKVCSVVGFPLGAMDAKAKLYEAKVACEAGADEVDMVVNVAALKAEWAYYIKDEISGVVETARSFGALTKVILETALLSEVDIVHGCKLAKDAGAEFVKTSTGFSTRGASIQDVQLMRSTVGPDMGIKASGGIKTREQAIAMIEAGATRIGTSSSIDIVKG